jgi:hypothetical protein
MLIFCNRKAIKEMRAAYLERRSSRRISYSLPTKNPPETVLARPISIQTEHIRVDLARKEQQIKNEITI